MRIYQRGDAWYLDYSFNGERRRRKIGRSKKDAELALKETDLQAARGIDPDRLRVSGNAKKEGQDTIQPAQKNEMVFDKLCEKYLEISEANKRPQSHRRDRVSIKNLLKRFKGKPIGTISFSELEDYKSLRKKQVKPATVNRELSCIKHMFNIAVDLGYIDSHRLHKIKKFKEPAGRVRYLADDEIPKVLTECAGYLKPIVIAALNTGMRKSEILNLKWGDIDMTNRFIRVRDSKTNEARTIPINQILFEELSRMGPKASSEYVFSHKDGTRYHEIYYGFQAAAKRAGINDFRFHDLRHTFASRLAIQGVDIRVIQELMGHKTIAMTMRYSHLTHKTLQEAVAKLCPNVPNEGQKSEKITPKTETSENGKVRKIDTKNGTKDGTNGTNMAQAS